MSTALQNAHSKVFQDAFKNGMQSFVPQYPSSQAAPALTATNSAPWNISTYPGTFYSTITNRAAIPDLTQDLKSSFGIERIMTQSIYQLQNEFGPNGEPVWSTPTDQFGQIRFVGGWSTLNDSSGIRMLGSTTSDYIEIAFYGTGINLLHAVYSTSLIDIRASTDGGSEGSNLWLGSTYSSVLLGRNYATNAVTNIVSGLSLGVHTVKIRQNGTSFDGFYGIEILNTNSTTALNVNPGSAYIDGLKTSLPTASAPTYKPAALSTTTGARVVNYLYQDGTLGQAFTAVPASSSTLTSASHANEEVVRVYNVLEFSAGRTDDFSSRNTSLWSTGGSAAFTLDDGTTTLVASGTTRIISGSFLNASNAADYWTITFVGTGIDVVLAQSGATNSSSFILDGVSLGAGSANLTQFTGAQTKKVASGLPYGTHTLQCLTASATNNLSVTQFIVYQPKTPSIPSGAVQLSSYNVMANYAANATAGLTNIGTGLLRKQLSQREATFVGTFTTPAINTALYIGGWQTNSSVTNSYDQYTFFGTGFELRGAATTSLCASISVTLNGLPATTASFSTLVSSFYGGWTFSAGTLSQAVSNTNGSGLSISGLPLGLYTVKFNANSASAMVVEAFDIITPIHSPKSNLYADLQNTLPVGSCAMSDDRQFTPIKNALPATKAWAQAVGITNNPTTSSTTMVPCPDMSVTIKTGSDGKSSGLRMQGQTTWNHNQNPGTCFLNIYVDGVAVGVAAQSSVWAATSGNNETVVFAKVAVAPGTHKVDMYWSTIAGTLTSGGVTRILLVEET